MEEKEELSITKGPTEPVSTIEAKGKEDIVSTPKRSSNPGPFDKDIWTVIGKNGRNKGSNSLYAGSSSQVYCDNGYGVLGGLNEPLVAFVRGP